MVALMSIFGLQISTAEFGLTKTEEGAIRSRTFAEMARQWWREMLPDHFQADAAERYGYTARKGERTENKRSYAARKAADGFGDVALVRTGRTRDLTLAMMDLRIGNKFAKVVLPRDWNFRHPASRVNMREEVTKILDVEARGLERVGSSAFAGQLSEVLYTKKRVVQ